MDKFTPAEQEELFQQIKIVVVGDGAVGKTSLIKRYHPFTP